MVSFVSSGCGSPCNPEKKTEARRVNGNAVVAFALDNGCMYRKMNEDPRLGYAIAMRLLERTYDRLARSRLQHLDVYK